MLVSDDGESFIAVRIKISNISDEYTRVSQAIFLDCLAVKKNITINTLKTCFHTYLYSRDCEVWDFKFDSNGRFPLELLIFHTGQTEMSSHQKFLTSLDRGTHTQTNGLDRRAQRHREMNTKLISICDLSVNID